MSKKKLTLNTLNIQSFITSIENSNKILAGQAQSETDPPTFSSNTPTQGQYCETFVGTGSTTPSDPTNNTSGPNTATTCTNTENLDQY